MKCCDMKAGEMRTPFTVKMRSTTSLAGGATDVDFDTTRFTGRCKFVALSGSERLHAERINATTRNRITARYNAALIESDVIVIGSKLYNIRFINNVELRNRWMIIGIDGGVPI